MLTLKVMLLMLAMPCHALKSDCKQYSSDDCSGDVASEDTNVDGDCYGWYKGSGFTICSLDGGTYDVYSFASCTDCSCAYTVKTYNTGQCYPGEKGTQLTSCSGYGTIKNTTST